MELTTENTAVVVDSTADFPQGPDRFPNWRVVPLYVRFGDESFRDYVDLGPEEFYAKLRTAAELPTTSQPTPGDFLDAYESLRDYANIYSVHVSGKLSGTLESARMAAAELGGGKVQTIDSQTASAAIAMLGLAIQRRLERGTTPEEVDELVERFRASRGLLFTVDTLEFLQKGGRIGRAQAWAGHLLNIKPILSISDGEVLPLKRVRGNQKAAQEFARLFSEGTEGSDGLRVGIAHADAPDRVDTIRSIVDDRRPDAEIEVVTTLGAVVGTHAGPGTVGFFWFADP